jgi:hypothetical protein
VRAGTPGVTGGIHVINTGNGSVFSFIDGLPANVGGTAPGVMLNTGDHGDFTFTLDTTNAGQFSAAGFHGAAFNQFGQLEFDNEGVKFGTAVLTFAGTVTQPANPELGLTGLGTLTPLPFPTPFYILSLGDFASGSGVVTTSLDVSNDIADTPWSETLGGSFAGDVAPFGIGFTSFSGLVGGGSIADQISFDTTGLVPGSYGEELTFGPVSSFPGLPDAAYTPWTVLVLAGIKTPTVSGVPEPATWALMIAGLGLSGAALRRGRARPAI